MTIQSSKAAAGSRVEEVYSHLREGIIRGRFRSGTHLNASSIAVGMNLSVIPVREAIRLLEAEGLVTIERNRGARVPEMSASDLEDIYLTRLALETDALQRAFSHLTEEDISAVDEALTEMVAAYERQSIPEAMGWHRRFHDLIYARANSPRLSQMIDALWSASDRYLWVSPQVFRDDNFKADHEPILLALRAGDLDQAVEALKVHHQRALSRISRSISGD